MQNFTELLMMNQRGASNKDFSHHVYITPDNAPRTIYVADLPKSVTYLELSEFMEKNIGTCVITIKRPMFTDFYFAFVQFQKLDDARKACSEFRFPTLCGVKCRILPFKFHTGQAANLHPFHPKPAPKNTQLFVKGLPRQWTHEDLATAFEKFGKVLSCKVSIDSEHNSKQYGFVQLDSEKASQQAIAKMNGFEVAASDQCDEATLTVCEFVPRLDRVGTMKPQCSTNLYVKNFPHEQFGDSDLKLMFAEFGEIVSAAVMRDADQNSRNFGFVCFKKSEDAKKALEHFKDQAASDDQQKSVFVSEFKTKRQRQLELERSTYNFKKSQHLLNLIVKNVDPSATKDEFEAFFKNFGEVRASKLLPDASIGFVCFVEREAARCAKETAELVFKGRKLQTDYCEPKEQRQKRQEEQWDRQQFHRQKASQLQSNNQDVIQLITSLSLLMGQLQQKGPNQNNNARQQQMNNYGGGNPQQRMNNQYQPRRNFSQQPAAGPQGGMQGGNQGQVMGQQHYQPRNNFNNQTMPMPAPNQMPTPQGPRGLQEATPQGQSSESQRYRAEIMDIFQSEKFMTSAEAQKKQMVGTHIFRYVTNLVTAEFSPKITGMIIDLPIADLNYAVSNLEILQTKVKSALQLLVETNNLGREQADTLPIFQNLAQQAALPAQAAQQQISGF